MDFARVRAPAGGHAEVAFELTAEALRLVNAEGAKVAYPGGHTLTIARGAVGNADDASFRVTVP